MVGEDVTFISKTYRHMVKKKIFNFVEDFIVYNEKSPMCPKNLYVNM